MSVSLTSAVIERQRLLEELQRETDALRLSVVDAKQYPVDDNVISDKIARLMETNRRIEEHRQKTLDGGDGCMKFVRQTTPLTYSVIVLTAISTAFTMCAFLGSLGIGIWNLTSNNSNDKSRGIAEIVVSIIGLFFTSCVGGCISCVTTSIKMMDDDNAKLESLAEISKVETQGEEHFQAFVAALAEFKSSHDQSAAEQKERLAQCIRLFDAMPDTGYRQQLPDRDIWISALIQKLPEGHPTKIKFNELKAEAEQILVLAAQQQMALQHSATMATVAASLLPPAPGQSSPQKSDSSNGGPTSSSVSDAGVPTPMPKTATPLATANNTVATIAMAAAVPQGDTHSSAPTVSDSAQSTGTSSTNLHAHPSDFSGEQSTFKEMLLRTQGPLGSLASIPLDNLAIAREAFKYKWSQLESDIGFIVDRVQLHSRALNRDGCIANTLADLPQPSPAPSRPGGSSRSLSPNDVVLLDV